MLPSASLLALSAALTAAAAPMDLDPVSPDFNELNKWKKAAAGFEQPVPPSAFSHPAAKPVDTPAAPAAKAEWLVMLFFNGKNNLAPAIMQDINEAAFVGSSPRVHIVAQVGQAGEGSGYTPVDDEWQGSRFFYLPGKSAMTPLSVNNYVPLKNQDMGDWGQLAGFIASSKVLYPAKRHLLVVSGHGGGWAGIAPDDMSSRIISIKNLAKALERGGGVDVYASDACLMQMAEVIYELRGRADVIVGSEEIEPGTGYNYRRVLQPLVDNPGMDAETVGRIIAEEYGLQYALNPAPGIQTTSAIRTHQIERFKQNFDRWTDVVLRHDEKDAIVHATQNVQRFEGSHSADLFDFVRLVSERAANEETRAAGKILQDHLKTQLVFANATVKAPRAHGLGISVPLKKDGAYKDVAWLADTRWRKILRQNDPGFWSWLRR